MIAIFYPGVIHEKDLSTEQAEEGQNSWLSRSYGNQERTQGSVPAKKQRAGRIERFRQGSSQIGSKIKPATLRGKTVFTELFSRGRRLHGANTAIRYLGNREGESRVAFCVSRKLGKAVVRNRIRRKCRASLEPLIGTLPPGWHIAILPGRQWQTMPPDRGTQEVRKLLMRAGILEPDGRTRVPGSSSGSTK